MFPKVDTRDPKAVRAACAAEWVAITGKSDGGLLERAFRQLEGAFAGRHPDYEPLDMRYHDLEHTMQGCLCLGRLLGGWHRSGIEPRLDERALRLGMTAIVLHDTGYLKQRGDTAGTGAKFTPVHVQRSAEFAGRLLPGEGYSAADVREIQNMIRCTGVAAKVDALSFENSQHRLMGCAIATADLLGQMAAEDYPEKLQALYLEFAESSVANPGNTGHAAFASAETLIRQTPAFWEKYVRPRLAGDFESVHRFLNVPWPDGPNEYLDRIEANVARIRAMVAALV